MTSTGLILICNPGSRVKCAVWSDQPYSGYMPFIVLTYSFRFTYNVSEVNNDWFVFYKVSDILIVGVLIVKTMINREREVSLLLLLCLTGSFLFTCTFQFFLFNTFAFAIHHRSVIALSVWGMEH